MYTLASELFHTHWSRGALCEMSSWCTLRGPSWFASHVSMCWMLRSCNPSWFVCNIFVCRRSTACAFICQCHWGSSSAPSLWILSCMLDESIAQAPLHCCHRHLLYLVLIALLLPLLSNEFPNLVPRNVGRTRERHGGSAGMASDFVWDGAMSYL